MTDPAPLLPFLADPTRLNLLLHYAVLLLPVLVAGAALIHLREEHAPRSAWLCVGAAVALFWAWIIPNAWLSEMELRALRSFVTIGLYAWVLFDWYRTVRDDGVLLLDWAVVAWVLGMAGLMLGAYFL